MSLSVFSTYAKDRITDKTGQVSEQTGGPLFYLEKALKDIKVDFNSFHGETITVEIEISDNGEVGRLVKFPKIIPLSADNASKFIIVSTIFDEYDLNLISKFNGKIFIDIQGYVRSRTNFEGKDNMYCLKGTKEEISLLSKKVYEDQKKRLLIVTDGEKGIEYFSEGKQYSVSMRKIASSNAVGAGDTLLGYFVGFLVKGNTVQKSISLAQRKTEYFLMNKSKEEYGRAN